VAARPDWSEAILHDARGRTVMNTSIRRARRCQKDEEWPVGADPERHRRPAHVAANQPT
jgi:hypothetical protein